MRSILTNNQALSYGSSGTSGRHWGLFLLASISAVKVAFSWTVVEPDGRTTTQLEQSCRNVPIDDAKFALPVLDKTSKDENGESGAEH